LATGALKAATIFYFNRSSFEGDYNTIYDLPNRLTPRLLNLKRIGWF
jgi:hypothetical protein